MTEPFFFFKGNTNRKIPKARIKQRTVSVIGTRQEDIDRLSGWLCENDKMYSFKGRTYQVKKLPPVTSFLSPKWEDGSTIEEMAFGHDDVILVAVDYTDLEKGLMLLVQAMELCEHLVFCITEFEEKPCKVNILSTDYLCDLLPIPLVHCSLDRTTTEQLKKAIETATFKKRPQEPPFLVYYGPVIEAVISMVQSRLVEGLAISPRCRWFSIALLEQELLALDILQRQFGVEKVAELNLPPVLQKAREILAISGVTEGEMRYIMAMDIFDAVTEIIDSL